MAINKVEFGNTTLIDLTDTTAEASDVASGKYFYTKAGIRTQGTNSGGSSKALQKALVTDYVRATSYTATDVTLTVKKSGTYNVFWCGWRSTSSGTSGSRLYINGTAYGSAHTSFTGTYGQSIKESNVQLDAGDVLVVRARSRSTSYYMYVCNLIIEEV